MDIITQYREHQEKRKNQEMTLMEYFELCKSDPSAYSTPAERMLTAIGQPVLVDTSRDARLSRIFENRIIKQYPAFEDFFGMESAIEDIVAFFKHAAQGLEERKQILYLLGPVGGGKSSLAERLKKLMEQCPVYTIKMFNKTTGKEELSPIFESPLGLFDIEIHGEALESQYTIPKRLLNTLPSPWAVKRLKECEYNLDTIKVVKMYPSIIDRTCVAKTEPGDENNQDISTLVGKVNIRRLEDYDQDDADAYGFTGGLCHANQGILEFVEMFKAPIKMLHPLLTATQEGNYNGTANFSAIPFNGIILAHSNESEWESFRNDKTNEAFLDRVCLIRVPYCLRIDEEIKIYQKLLEHSDLNDKPCAPDTLEMLARFVIMSRLKDPENSNLFSKARIYNGESLKDSDPGAKAIHEYRDDAGITEGMAGMSTRFAFKVLSNTFNFDNEEIAADPILLMAVLQRHIKSEQLPNELQEHFFGIIKGILATKYAKHIGEELQKAYLESYSEYGQNLFDRYVTLADAWLNECDFRDPQTQEHYDREQLDEELQGIEKPAGIGNPKDFRNEVVRFVMRERANNQGQSPKWTSYEKLRRVIESKMFSNTEDLLPVISFGTKPSEDDERKHRDFVDRMVDRGYTEKQVRRAVEWYQRYKKHS